MSFTNFYEDRWDSNLNLYLNLNEKKNNFFLKFELESNRGLRNSKNPCGFAEQRQLEANCFPASIRMNQHPNDCLQSALKKFQFLL